MTFFQSCQTPVGRMVIRSDGAAVTGIVFSDVLEPELPNALTELTVQQIREYFAGTRAAFDLPLRLSGTPFMQAVCRALLDVPFGQTTTYGLLSAKAGYPGAARAVGTVMRKNPLVLVVPCHRVLAANGLGGYSCGLDKKRWLLRHEGVGFKE